MKKVIIIGASGSLAPYVISALKGLADAKLTLFVRNQKRLAKDSAENCTVIEGDAMDFNKRIFTLENAGPARRFIAQLNIDLGKAHNTSGMKLLPR
ncbi:hypothetical protein [Mucilaginibacter sp. SP1R1]|uniref:hypothetical protein n=1 Tax=Mucilaginibacter sp. SP1R1 TaxID=2723091 RepID=UPI0016166F73|nr:hypothetical protein [Mucilaginibacter sp. SP1R1]MBB6149384.1 uncharacterized protein YbjT (DUF2867 family) [Mucilaginibacter sp. SP1R1]